jgi:hypothetical protein
MKPKKLPKVSSLYDLFDKARTDTRYRELLMISANNLGGDCKTEEQAQSWLRTNAMETDEEGVVGEINFCRDLVK